MIYEVTIILSDSVKFLYIFFVCLFPYKKNFNNGIVK